MTKSVVVIGPYIGDFEQEVFTFRPYARYISFVSENPNVVVSSHYNRSFLYDWIPECNFIPVFESLTREELKQSGYLHEDVSKSDYTQLVKYLKNKVKEQFGKVEIEFYPCPYIKSDNTISLYQKMFDPIQFPRLDDHEEDYIVLITSQSKISTDVYNSIKNKFNIKVVGNMTNGNSFDNILLKSPDYFSNGYISMMNYVLGAKLVVTNIPAWAIISNTMKKNLLYWGTDCSQFKSDGIYGFDNINSTSIDVKKETIPEMIEYKYGCIK